MAKYIVKAELTAEEHAALKKLLHRRNERAVKLCQPKVYIQDFVRQTVVAAIRGATARSAA